MIFASYHRKRSDGRLFQQCSAEGEEFLLGQGFAAAAGVDGGGIEDGGKVVDDVGSVEDEGAPNTTRQGAIHGP